MAPFFQKYLLREIEIKISAKEIYRLIGVKQLDEYKRELES